MAKKKKTRSRIKVGTKRAGKSRMKNASNSCCPVIHIDCKPVVLRKKVTEVGADTVISRTIKQSTGAKKCRIRFGRTTFGKGFKLSSEDAGKKVAQLKTALAAKRCMQIVDTGKAR